MADVFSAQKRREIMQSVKSRDTAPEIVVRKLLHSLGLRFRLHRKDLPGRPDIYLPKHKTVVFVHGCFWHGHRGCKRATIPKTREEFWRTKIERNRARDIQALRQSRQRGLRPIVVWGCEAAKKAILGRRLRRLLKKGG